MAEAVVEAEAEATGEMAESMTKAVAAERAGEDSRPHHHHRLPPLEQLGVHATYCHDVPC